MNDTLVVLIGDLRCGEAAWESLYRNVLDVNNADLMLIVQQTTKYPNASLHQRAVAVEMVPNFTDWALPITDWIFNGNNDSWESQLLQYYTPQSHPTLLGGVGDYRASTAIIGVYKWLVLHRLQRQPKYANYRRIVVTRTDQLYECPLDLNRLDWDLTKLWVPMGEDYGGICDRFMVFDASIASQSLNILQPFLKHPARFTKRLTPNTNPEYFLMHLWREAGLYAGRFPRSFYTCMAENDASRWGHPEGYLEHYGVHLKYKTEYEPALQTCGRTKNK